MRPLLHFFGWIVVMTAAIGSSLSSADSPPTIQAKNQAAKPALTTSPGAAAKPPTVRAAKGPFKISLAVKGLVEAEQMHELALRPKAWAPPEMRAILTVLKAVEHGNLVRKGDVLVELDLEKINEAIRELKADQLLAHATIQQAEEELPVLEKLVPVDLASAERGKQQADEDLKRFLEIDRPLAEQNAQHSVKTANHYLDSAREELKQLEKMYRSKDLTEETEEFILKRHRFEVESAQFNLKTALIRSDQVLKVELPRKEQAAKENAVKQALALQKASSTLPLSAKQKQLALLKMRLENQKTAKRLTDLESDREAMTVRAPADGVVYYGRCVRGQWPPASAGALKLRPGSQLMPEEVFLTIVCTRPIFVRAMVPEMDLHHVQSGLKGTAVLTSYPDIKLPAQITRVSAIPQEPGSFEALIAVEGSEGAKAIMPGMNCTVKFVAYQKADALTVPSSAVFADEEDEEAHYVYRLSKNGKPDKRSVKVGRTSAKRSEILEGLNPGDEILTTKPEGKP